MPEAEPAPKADLPKVTLRRPTPEDGAAVWELVRRAGTLDRNSAYLYILLCDRFADTCLVAEGPDGLLGFVTGFIPPRSPDTLFIWQIGVAPEGRGQGLAGRLLREAVALPACADVTRMETTITPSNTASDALFRSFARRMAADVEVDEGFTGSLFPEPNHEPERLYRIGPLQPPKENA